MQNIIHYRDTQCFSIEKDNMEAVLQYKLDPKTNTVDFYRTYVPIPLRGQCIAESLVKTGLEWARSENLDIKASCWYVEKFL